APDRRGRGPGWSYGGRRGPQADFSPDGHRDEPHARARREQRRRVSLQIEQAQFGAADALPAAGRRRRVDSAEPARERDRTGRYPLAWCALSLYVVALGQSAEVREAGSESAERDVELDTAVRGGDAGPIGVPQP